MTSDIHTDTDADADTDADVVDELAGPTRTTRWRTNVLTSADVQRRRRNGREYLEFPVIALREMVYDYPENGTREFLPADHIRETADVWEGAAVTFRHPENRYKTAANPDAYTGEVIGQAHSPSMVDGDKLRVQALVDVEKARGIGGAAADVVDRLEAGEELSVSAGYATEAEPATGTHDGDTYDRVQQPPWPDHVAVFSSDEFTARCSPADGCAAPRANANATDDATSDTMSTTTDADDSTVFRTEGEHEAARQAVAAAYDGDIDVDELADKLAAEIAADDEMDTYTGDEAVYLLARDEGWTPAGCDHTDGLCQHDLQTLNLTSESNPDVDAADADGATTNADGCTCNCECGGQTANGAGVDTQLPAGDDPAYYDGGESIDDYPAGGRAAFERRRANGEAGPEAKKRQPHARSRSQPDRVNYGAIPGQVDRSVDVHDTGDDPEDYPAGGRSAWEERAGDDARANAADQDDRSAWQRKRDFKLGRDR